MTKGSKWIDDAYHNNETKMNEDHCSRRGSIFSNCINGLSCSANDLISSANASCPKLFDIKIILKMVSTVWIGSNATHHSLVIIVNYSPVGATTLTSTRYDCDTCSSVLTLPGGNKRKIFETVTFIRPFLNINPLLIYS